MAGIEPARGNPNGLAIHRLNHSATYTPPPPPLAYIYYYYLIFKCFIYKYINLILISILNYMGKKNSKKQTGGNLKLIFSVLLSILIVFLLMNYIYTRYCDGFMNNTANFLRDLTKQDGIKDRRGICKALKDILGY